MDKDIMVSICCLTYNHKKYIRKCLDGIFMQKTNFSFEVLLHDDASTDGTQDIIREYEEKFPGTIKPIYQKENQYSKKRGINKTFQYPRIKGKYVAYCEGDDFWTDPLKLQKQVDVLENNQDCTICVHKVCDVLENGNEAGSFHPKFELDSGRITASEYMDIISGREAYQFQTTSYLIRSSVLKTGMEENPDFLFNFGVGDVPVVLLSITKGNMYYLNDTMSCYRLMSEGSWNLSIRQDPNKKINYLKKLIRGYNSFNDYTNGMFNEQINKITEEKQFTIEMMTNNYKNCLKKSYKKYLSKRERLYMIMAVYTPNLLKIYKKITVKKNGK